MARLSMNVSVVMLGPNRTLSGGALRKSSMATWAASMTRSLSCEVTKAPCVFALCSRK